MNGILCINKPQQFTSFDVVAVVRGLLKTKRVGHAGTLDPMATGVLPVMAGNATKAISFLPDHNKSYEAQFRLGLTTDTQDIWGTVLSSSEVRCTAEAVEQQLPAFTGEIQQVPPMYSAVKHEGRRLYELARAGVAVDRPARKVTVHALRLTAAREAAGLYTIAVTCSAGTYIRTLIHDLGAALGCGAVMTALCRTGACGFTLAGCITLEQARTMALEGTIQSRLLLVDSVFEEYQAVSVSPAQFARFANGGELSLERVPAAPAKNETRVRVYSPDGRVAGLGVVDADEGSLRVLKLFR